MRKNKDVNPIFYPSAAEMDSKPMSQLMEELRSDLAKVRGKLFDIKMSYGWEDRIEHLEGGLTCIIAAMHPVMEEWKVAEEKRKLKESNVAANTIEGV